MKLHLVHLATCWPVLLTSLAAAQIPPPPTVPTVDSCRAYMLDNHARRAAILREASECTRTFPWNFSDRYTLPVCNWPPTRIELTKSAYNCPQRASELCALVDAERQINECYKRARSTSTQQEERLQRIKKFNELERKLNAVQNAKKDPRRLFWEVVEPRLPAETKARLGLAFRQTNSELAKGTIPLELTKSGDSLSVVSLFNRNGEYTQRGSSLMQETYDFVYSKTIGNSILFQTNPIIGAIRGTAAGEIKNIHSSIIYKIDSDIRDGVEAILEYAPPHHALEPSRTLLPKPFTPAANRAAPTDPTCAVLDGPGAADLSINSPEVFEQLINKCRR